MFSLDLSHFLFIYEQTLFNFSNIKLQQRIHFLRNPVFIHPAVRNAILLFEQLSKLSKPQLWLLDTFGAKKM